MIPISPTGRPPPTHVLVGGAALPKIAGLGEGPSSCHGKDHTCKPMHTPGRGRYRDPKHSAVVCGSAHPSIRSIRPSLQGGRRIAPCSRAHALESPKSQDGSSRASQIRIHLSICVIVVPLQSSRFEQTNAELQPTSNQSPRRWQTPHPRQPMHALAERHQGHQGHLPTD